MTANEIKTCIIYEKKYVTYNEKEFETLKLSDAVLCLYNPVYDNYIHMSGKFMNKKTEKEFESEGSNYAIYPFDVTEVAKYIPTGYDIENIISEAKDGFEYFYLNEFGNIVRIKDKKLLEIAKKAFGKSLDYFKLEEYTSLKDAPSVLKKNIDILSSNYDALERDKFIDEELDRYNSYVKRVKINN